MDINKILELVSKVIDLEQKIETEIRTENDAKKRKKVRKAVKKRDSAALRDVWFK